MDLGRRSFPTAVGWFSLAQRSHECSRVPGAAQREAISVFTRVFDALWRNGALQAPISGLPEIGAHMRKSGKPDLRGSLRSVAVPDQRCTAPLRYALHRVRDATASDAFGVLFTFQTAHLVPAARLCTRGLRLCFTHPKRGVGGAPRDVRVRARHPLSLHMTRQARRLRGALRPMTRDARLSALHRGGFGPRGRASLTDICAGSVTASSSQPGRSA